MMNRPLTFEKQQVCAAVKNGLTIQIKKLITSGTLSEEKPFVQIQ